MLVAVTAAVLPAVLDGGGDSEELDVAGPPSTQDPGGWTQLPEPPLSPRTGASAAWTGTEVVVFGYRHRNGSNAANGRDVTLPDGRRLFITSPGTGAPGGD